MERGQEVSKPWHLIYLINCSFGLFCFGVLFVLILFCFALFHFVWDFFTCGRVSAKPFRGLDDSLYCCFQSPANCVSSKKQEELKGRMTSICNQDVLQKDAADFYFLYSCCPVMAAAKRCNHSFGSKLKYSCWAYCIPVKCPQTDDVAVGVVLSRMGSLITLGNPFQLKIFYAEIGHMARKWILVV